MKKTLIIFVPSLLLCSALFAAPAATTNARVAAQCADGGRLVTELGQRKQSSGTFTPGQRVLRVGELGAKYMRVRLRAQNAQGCRWFVTVRDGHYRVIETLTAHDFADPASPTRWTARIPGDSVVLALDGCGGGAAGFPDVGYDQLLAMPDQSSGTFYSSQDPDHPQFMPLYSSAFNADKPLGDYVGFLIGSYETRGWGCSGVVVAPDLFLTNWHCGRPDDAGFPDADVWGEKVKKDVIIDLSWDDDQLSREFSVAEVAVKDKDLDFALLRIVPINATGDPRPAPLRINPVSANQQITIVHHPAGRQKQISSNCRVVSPTYASWINKTAGTDFTHRCDTEGGSSGAPVFNADGEVVGLHHRGFDFEPGTCKPDKLNKAVRIGKIYEYIKSARPDLASRIETR
jgi:hypothetical protein